MADTTTKGFPYPEGTDAVDVAGDIQALADFLDDIPGIQSFTGTQIGNLTSGEKWAGRVVWNSTTGKLQVSNGSTFSDVDTTALASTNPAALGVAAPGNGTTAARDNHVHAMPSASDVGAVPSNAQPTVLAVAVSDEVTNLTTGTAKVTFRMPFAMTVTAVRASLATASSSGNPTFDINEGGTSILGANKLSIDANEKTSTTAATATSISDSALADDAEITIDIDTAGTGAKGAKVYIIGTRA